MRRIRVIPILLIDNGRAVITRKFKNPIYVGDPINAIKIFNDKEVDDMIILDITDKRKQLEPNYDLISDMASESFMPLAYGGHIGEMSQADRIISSGIEKLCFNTALYDNPDTIKAIAARYGNQSVVASVDVKRNIFGGKVIKTNGGRKTIRLSVEKVTEHLKQLNVGEVLLTSIDHDGMMNGYDYELIELFKQYIETPLVACGGASNLTDFKYAISSGASAIAAGAMFYFKGDYNSVLINYPDQKELIENLYGNF